MILSIFKLLYVLLLIVQKVTSMKKNALYSAVHTFSRAPSLAQICSYLVIATESIIFYLMIRPNIQSETTSIILTTLFSISLFILLITTFICSYIDPSDSIMVKYKSGKRQEIPKNIQLQLFCDYCQSYVTQNAKHCRQCDRCVQDFDHHCMWINNCVGSKNYKAFIVMITSTCVNLGVYLASVVCLSVERQWNAFLGFIVTCWVIMVVVFILWFLLFNLNILHFYLMCKGYTTYQFIVIRKEEERIRQLQQAQRAQRQKDERIRTLIQNSKKKLTQISPQQPQKKMEENPRTPKKQEQKKKSIHELSQQNTNAQIKISENMRSSSKKDEKLETTNAKIKQTDQNVDNVFNAFYGNKNDSQNDVNSIKIDSLSIKADVIDDGHRKNQNEKINSDEDDNSSIRISQFFIRNKSFNYILSNQQVDKPHKKGINMSVVVDSKGDNRSKERVNSTNQHQKLKNKSTSDQNLLANKRKKQKR